MSCLISRRRLPSRFPRLLSRRNYSRQVTLMYRDGKTRAPSYKVDPGCLFVGPGNSVEIPGNGTASFYQLFRALLTFLEYAKEQAGSEFSAFDSLPILFSYFVVQPPRSGNDSSANSQLPRVSEKSRDGSFQKLSSGHWDPRSSDNPVEISCAGSASHDDDDGDPWKA